MLGAQGLWAGRDLYRATPTVTRGLGFSGLIRRTSPFSCLLRHTRGCGVPILSRILTGQLTKIPPAYPNLLKGEGRVYSPITVFLLWCPVCLTLNSIWNIFLQWVAYMCDMVTLGGKDNGLKSPDIIFLLWCPVCLTFDLKFNREHLPPIDSLYVCDMVTLGGKDNGLEPGNHISTLMSSVLDLWPFDFKINKEHIFLP
jgi:hypothetical protein